MHATLQCSTKNTWDGQLQSGLLTIYSTLIISESHILILTYSNIIT